MQEQGALWQRVYDTLAREIQHGALTPQGRIPSERDLGQRFSVSRVTVRRALAELAKRGLIASSNGLGWFVRSAQIEEPPNELVSFRQMGEALGLRVSSRVLIARTRPASLDE